MSESILSHILLYECLSWGFSWDQEKIRPTDITNRSEFLSSLALILNGNATCTAVYVSEADQIVFIARNEPIMTNDQRYFDRFFRQIQMYADLCLSSCSDKDKARRTEKAEDQLESLVFEYNSKKIVTRFIGRNSKLIDELRKMVQWNTNEKSQFIEQLRSNRKSYTVRPLMTEKIYLISKNSTDEDYVQFLLTNLDDFLVARDQLIENQVNPTDHQLTLATGLATRLYQSRLFRYILNQSVGTGDIGLYYFEKTSGHTRSLDLILKCLLKQKDYYGEIYQNISWKLIPSIERTEELKVTPQQAFEKIFTNLSHSPNEDLSNIVREIPSDTFYDQYLKQLKIIDETPSYVGHVHAEILLIDYLLKNNINRKVNSNEVEIGISKMPCLLCSYYIDALNQKHHRCFYQRGSIHGKIYSKWIYRPNEDPSILNMINDKLIDKIQHSIQKLCLETDRHGPKKSGDSDIIYTSLEEDQFDEKKCSKIDSLKSSSYVFS